MTLKSGEVPSENEDKKVQTEDKNLLALIAKLSKQVEDLEKKQQAKAFEVPSGSNFTPEILEKILKSVTNKDKDIDYEAGIYEEQIPVDDYDKTGVRFCAPSVGYCIVDDIREGRRVKIPYGKKSIFFEYSATRRMQQGKYQAVAPYSVYTSHSKAEIEWLRAHGLYQLKFYESSTDAANASAEKIQKTASIISILQNYDLPQLIQQCHENGIPQTEDPRIMRLNLAHKLVESEIDLNISQQKNSMEETYKAQNLLGKK